MSNNIASQRILIAEDEPDVAKLVETNLKKAGFTVLVADDGAKALRMAREERPALLILDLMLPEMPGLEVCKVLKRDPATRHIPIIMLTAKSEEVDRVVGLELGADDYVTKPFSPRELVLRVQSILRRAVERTSTDEPLAIGGIVIDRERCTVSVRGKNVDFTATELKLLILLMERRGRVQSRDALLNEVWGYQTAIDTRTVDTHIRRVREKLAEDADIIETVRGFGYRVAGG